MMVRAQNAVKVTDKLNLDFRMVFFKSSYVLYVSFALMNVDVGAGTVRGTAGLRNLLSGFDLLIQTGR
jgi:hypothetical protein